MKYPKYVCKQFVCGMKPTETGDLISARIEVGDVLEYCGTYGGNVHEFKTLEGNHVWVKSGCFDELFERAPKSKEEVYQGLFGLLDRAYKAGSEIIAIQKELEEILANWK